MKSTLFTWLAPALLLVCAGTAAEEPAPDHTVPYSEVFEMMALVEGAGLDLLQTSISAYSEDRTADREGIVFTVEGDGETLEFEADFPSRVILPYRPEWVEAGYTVSINRPQGSFGFFPSMEPKPFPSLKMRYRDVMAYIPQYTRYNISSARKMNYGQPHPVGGLMLAYRDGAPHRAVIHAPWGVEVIESNEYGRIELNLDYVLLAENPIIELDAMPDFVFGTSG